MTITNNKALNYVIWLLFIVFSIIDLFTTPPSHPLSRILTVTELASTIAILKFPIISCSVILITCIVGTGIPLPNAAILWPFLYALMLLTYRDKKLQAISAAFIMGGISYYKYYRSSGGNYNPSGIIAISLLFILIGYQANNYNRRNQELRKTQKIKELELKENISINLHDSITNQLSYIILLAETKINENTEQSSTYSMIERSAQSALQSTHQIINMLIDGNSNSTNSIQWVEKIHELTVQYTDKLAAINIHGKTSIQWAGIASLSREQQSYVFSLLEEIYFNILKHCTKQCEYFITVKKIDDLVCINEMNTIDAGKKPLPIFQSGRGLASRKKQIEAFDGTLEFGQENMIWTLHARMPVH